MGRRIQDRFHHLAIENVKQNSWIWWFLVIKSDKSLFIYIYLIIVWWILKKKKKEEKNLCGGNLNLVTTFSPTCDKDSTNLGLHCSIHIPLVGRLSIVVVWTFKFFHGKKTDIFLPNFIKTAGQNLPLAIKSYWYLHKPHTKWHAQRPTGSPLLMNMSKIS